VSNDSSQQQHAPGSRGSHCEEAHADHQDVTAPNARHPSTRDDRTGKGLMSEVDEAVRSMGGTAAATLQLTMTVVE
jgi:hypothetical protein